jgi:hypothetical protein
LGPQAGNSGNRKGDDDTVRRLAALPPAPAIARHESPALAFATLPAFERLPDAGFCPRPAWQGSDAGFARGLFD